MTDTPSKPRLVELAEQELANAQDNLHRARASALGHDTTAGWCMSGRSLGDIIAGYERWEAEARETLEQAKEATR